MSAQDDLAAYFDQWYSDMAQTPRTDEIQQRHLGLPPHLLSTSLLTWDGIAEVTEALALAPGEVLLDVACGRGGYGLDVARRSGARLVGVDFSAVAVRLAEAQAARLERPGRFRVGSLEDTGLETGSVDAVVCVDAVQFARPPAAAYSEIRRVLRPAGRVALTCWEAVDPDDDGVPLRIRQVDLRGGLEHAGLEDVAITERPQWRAQELAMWREAADLDPGDDPALRSFHDEGVRVLERPHGLRRVLATAVAPA